tara:strand:+ start:2728 stop:2922 length:195 start_codon:yes stop_codon:yes gene_type:complete
MTQINDKDVTIDDVPAKIQAINAAQSAFATIESIKPGAIEYATKMWLAELKLDLMTLQVEDKYW